MNVLVTGGSGLVGYNLAKALLVLGYNVYSTSGGNGNKAVGNVLYRGMFGINAHDLPPKIDCLVHSAANNDTRYQDLGDMTRVNVEDSLRLFSMCHYRGCGTFIYASSTAVYGDSLAPYVEDRTPLNPLTPYAKSKLELEREAEAFGQQHGVRMVGLRYCNIYGPGEDHKGNRSSMIYQLIRQKAAGQRPTLYRDGEQKRDWLHVVDAVGFNILAMRSKFSGIVNVGGGRAATFNELLGLIFGEADPEWIDCPYPSEYQNHTCCDITRAATFGWCPSMTLEKGVGSYLAAYLNNTTTLS